MNKWKLKECLEAHNMTQDNLAAAIGINRNTLSRKLNGKSCFKDTEISDICKILEISTSDEKVKIFLQ